MSNSKDLHNEEVELAKAKTDLSELKKKLADKEEELHKRVNTEIIIAIIGACGAIAVAFIANWDKIFYPSPNMSYNSPEAVKESFLNTVDKSPELSPFLWLARNKNLEDPFKRGMLHSVIAASNNSDFESITMMAQRLDITLPQLEPSGIEPLIDFKAVKDYFDAQDTAYNLALKIDKLTGKQVQEFSKDKDKKESKAHSSLPKSLSLVLGRSSNAIDYLMHSMRYDQKSNRNSFRKEAKENLDIAYDYLNRVKKEDDIPRKIIDDIEKHLDKIYANAK